MCRENAAANREARIATGNAGSREAKVSTAMKSSWTVSVTRVVRPMRRRGKEQRKVRRSRQWVTKTSSLVREYFKNIFTLKWEENMVDENISQIW